MYNEKLDIFLTAADSGSFAKAADMLFTTSTSVMNQINMLEKHLGFRLFDRTTRGIRLTQAGASIYRDALAIKKHSDEAISRALGLLDETGYIIRIGSSVMRPSRPLMNLWNRIGAETPVFQPEIIPFSDQWDSYQNTLLHLGEEIDMICGMVPPDRYFQHYKITELWKVPICVAVPIHHPLASRKILTVQDLYGQDIMMVRRGSVSHIDTLRDDLETHHSDISIMDVPDYDFQTFNYCVRTKRLMISASIWEDVHPSLVTLPVEWDYRIPYGVITAEDAGAEIEAFLGVIRGAMNPLE